MANTSSSTVITYHAHFLAIHVHDQWFILWFTTNLKHVSQLQCVPFHTHLSNWKSTQWMLIGFEFLIAFFSSVWQCSPVNSYQRFEGVFFHHLKGRSRYKKSAIVTNANLCFIHLCCKFGQTVQLHMSEFSVVGVIYILHQPPPVTTMKPVIKRNWCSRFSCPTSNYSLWISVLFPWCVFHIITYVSVKGVSVAVNEIIVHMDTH